MSKGNCACSSEYYDISYFLQVYIYMMKNSYRYPDGSEYNGEWNDDGQRNGFGVMKFPDGSQYYGSFNQGLCDGHGIMIFSDHSRYI